MNKMYCDLCGSEVFNYKGFIYPLNDKEKLVFHKLKKDVSDEVLLTPYICKNCNELFTDICNLMMNKKGKNNDTNRKM